MKFCHSCVGKNLVFKLVMVEKLKPVLVSLGLVIIGFFWGQLMAFEQQSKITEPRAPYTEVSIIEFLGVEGDQLKLEVFGPARLLWAEDKLLEGSGIHHLPLGQLPNAQDLKFQQFKYTGNAKTGKFYPSTSYPARGTAVRDRRFFKSKQAALAAGFIATKLVK